MALFLIMYKREEVLIINIGEKVMYQIRIKIHT